jgi:hypothetical protein
MPVPILTLTLFCTFTCVFALEVTLLRFLLFVSYSYRLPGFPSMIAFDD